MPTNAKTYIALVLATGAGVLFFAASRWSPTSLLAFFVFLGVALFASTMKVRIPEMTGTMSPNFAVLLIGMASFSFSEVIVAAFGAALVQSMWRAKQRPQMVQVLFNAAALPVSYAISFWLASSIVRYLMPNFSVALVLLAGCFYLAVNTALVSMVVGLAEGRRLGQAWRNCYESVFPYFLAGILLTGLLTGSPAEVSAWSKTLILVPFMALAHFYVAGRQRVAAQPAYQQEESQEERELVEV